LCGGRSGIGASRCADNCSGGACLSYYLDSCVLFTLLFDALIALPHLLLFAPEASRFTDSLRLTLSLGRASMCSWPGGAQMDSDIPAQITQLRSLSRQQLLELWQKLYQKSAPEGVRREILIPFLAYRIQENAYGGLKPSARSELRRIARELERSKDSSKLRVRQSAKTGTRIYREWRGETHEVIVTKTGYEYRGVACRSLSQIARKITGVQWSGPAFFRLNRAHTAREH
jgi:hypothetical protein